MISSILVMILSIIMVIALFFTLLLLSKQPKNLWMLIPSSILGLVFAHLTVDEFDNDWMSYLLIFPLVLFCVLGLLYNTIPQSTEKTNHQTQKLSEQ
ncbi:MAG: hypothetical protein GY810_25360 [Aureispira sp.]|nr:hypothetical protein [Aureispira sp.]